MSLCQLVSSSLSNELADFHSFSSYCIFGSFYDSGSLFPILSAQMSKLISQENALCMMFILYWKYLKSKYSQVASSTIFSFKSFG